MPTPDLRKALKHLQAGDISPAEFDSYMKTGKTDSPPLGQGQLPPTLQTQAPVATTAAPGLMGGPVLDAARNMTMDGVRQTLGSIPAMANDKVRGVKDLLQGALKTAAPAAAIPGAAAAVAAPVATGVGLAGSWLGSKLGKTVTQGLGLSKDAQDLGETAGGVVGGALPSLATSGIRAGARALGGAVDSGAGLTPDMKAAQLWQQNKAAQASKELELAHNKLNLNDATADKTQAVQRVTDAKVALKSAIDATKSGKPYANSAAVQAKVELAEKQLDNSVAIANAKQAVVDAARTQNAGPLADFHLEQQNLVQRLQNETPVKAKLAANAARDAVDAKTSSKVAIDNLKAEAQRAGTYDDGPATQAQFTADMHNQAGKTSKAQDALDKITRNLNDHKAEMTKTETSIRKEDIADTMGKVDDLKNSNDLSRAGYHANGTAMSESDMEAAKLDRAKNSIQARMLSRDAIDTSSGVNGIDVIHKPEVLAKLADLTQAQKDAAAQLAAEQDKGFSLAQQKADHKVEMAKKAAEGKAVTLDPALSKEADKALEAAKTAQDAARSAREAHLDHLQTVQDAKDNLTLTSPSNTAEVAPGQDLQAAQEALNNHFLTKTELARQKLRLGLIAPETIDAADSTGIASAAQEHEAALTDAHVQRNNHYDLRKKVTQNERELLDLNPGSPPAVPLTMGERLAKLAKSQVIPGMMGVAGHMSGIPGAGPLAAGAGEAMMAQQGAFSSSAPRTAATMPPISSTPPPEVLKALLDKIGGTGGSANNPLIPDMLRQLLQGGQGDQQPPQQ